MRKKDDRWESASSSSSEEEERPAVEEEEARVPPPQPPPTVESPRKRCALFDGCRSVEEFQRLDRIDEGTYGVVYRARDMSSKEVVALKRVKLTRESCGEGFPITALRETNVLLALRHQHIVSVHEMVVGRDHDKVFMVMDYYDHDIKTCIAKHEGAFPQSVVKTFCKQLVSAIDHMHKHWFIHRDIKTSNLLYSSDRGKLAVCDFGLARRYGDPVGEYTRNVVTLWYRAPELLMGATTYSTELDCWSAGCVFAELLQKMPLFAAKSEIDQLAEIFKLLGNPTQERWPGYDSLPFAKHLKWKAHKRNRLRDKLPLVAFADVTPLSPAGFDLLNSLLALDPRQRLAARDALHHAYFIDDPPPAPPHLMPRFPIDRL